MAELDAVDLRAKLVSALDLGTTTSVTDARLYELLSNAQRRVVGILASHVPDVNTAHGQLTSSDAGATYVLSAFPMGHLELRDGRNGPVLVPCTDWDDVTDGYLLEGLTIRFPNNRSRTFTNGLWAKYTATPSAISAISAPTMKPEHGRMAIVYSAAEEFALSGGAVDSAPYQALLQRFLFGDPLNPGDIGLIGQLKTQRFFQGAPSASIPSLAWWRSSPDFVSH